MQTVNTRKTWVVYFSFLELAHHLSDEDSWCPLCVDRTVDLKHIESGISQVMAVCVKLFFGSHTFDMRVGIQLVSEDNATRVRLYVDLKMFLQDGGAHKAVWGCKGDAGTRFCMLCKNLVSQKSGITEIDGTRRLICSLIHESQMQFATDDEIHGAIRRLRGFKATASKAEFKLRQQAIGFTFQERGLLTDDELSGMDVVKPASQFCHDWMHGCFNQGIFNLILFLALAAVARAKPKSDIWNKV